MGVRERDWRQLRELRLMALADTPHAFTETFLSATTQTEEDWIERARRCEQADHTGFAALVDSRWVGTMRCEVTPAGPAYLLGVFVAPGHRGRREGVSDALLDRVELWAAGRGVREMLLEVHEDNQRAQEFYLRRGYSFTGGRAPYPLQPSDFELEMRRLL